MMYHQGNNSMNNMTGLVSKKRKVVLLGDAAVGKTALLNRALSDTFGNKYTPTVGTDLRTVSLTVVKKSIRTTSEYQLQIWDTTGHERFRKLVESYLRDCQVAVIVFSVKQRSSFENVQEWVKLVRSQTTTATNTIPSQPQQQQQQQGTGIPILLLGNAVDASDADRQVSMDQGHQAAIKYGCVAYGEVSAKAGYNVRRLLHKVAKVAVQQRGS